MTKSNKKIKLPDWAGPINDLIPNEVLYDAFRLNVWLGAFVSVWGMMAVAETATDKAKEKAELQGIGFNALLAAISPAAGVANYLFGSESGGGGVGIIVDWTTIQTAAKDSGNDLSILLADVMADDFLRRSIIASGVASAIVWQMFERDLLAGAGEILKGVGEIVPG